ncbi:hypothetical protein BC939DRAFT_490830 [Gamsiella multidivaricata]|uniref:uncharacterized protein n=1 Tax=Gamsiella multidivaricata TaxID=101098 RepID=UPI00221FF5CF|nr:uncharacterized protein BC939DRAFT_490830 [Gamsiella multidivaricata]KAI7828583.1 hypothetical protein BC939DRAFT_490830 [Gamsiella multidivaricata]
MSPVPPPPPPPSAGNAQPTSEALKDRGALLSQILSGTRLRPAITDDRSAPFTAGHGSGVNSTTGAAPTTTCAPGQSSAERSHLRKTAPPPPPPPPPARGSGALSPTLTSKPAPGFPNRRGPASPPPIVTGIRPAPGAPGPLLSGISSRVDVRPLSPLSPGLKPIEPPAIEGRWAFRSVGDFPTPPLGLSNAPRSYPSGNSTGTSIPLDLTSFAGLSAGRMPPPPPLGTENRCR